MYIDNTWKLDPVHTGSVLLRAGLWGILPLPTTHTHFPTHTPKHPQTSGQLRMYEICWQSLWKSWLAEGNPSTNWRFSWNLDQYLLPFIPRLSLECWVQHKIKTCVAVTQEMWPRLLTEEQTGYRGVWVQARLGKQVVLVMERSPGSAGPSCLLYSPQRALAFPKLCVGAAKLPGAAGAGSYVSAEFSRMMGPHCCLVCRVGLFLGWSGMSLWPGLCRDA